MKIGMLFESGPQGAEKQVCEELARRIKSGVQLVSVTHRNKPEMIAECGKDVVNLLKEGCKRILIVWDLFPPWREDKKPCRREDRKAILQSLKDAGVAKAPVFLVCIREELEAWLLADEYALHAFLSTPAHPAKEVPVTKHPDDMQNPKGRLKKIFQLNHRGTYNDLVHAIKIIKNANLKRLLKSDSFRRFEEKLK